MLTCKYIFFKVRYRNISAIENETNKLRNYIHNDGGFNQSLDLDLDDIKSNNNALRRNISPFIDPEGYHSIFRKNSQGSINMCNNRTYKSKL